MDLGVMIEGQEGLDWERWRRIFRAVEDLGFESLWRSDHYFSLMGDRRQAALEPFVSMTLLAAETARIRFGPLVSSATFRHPALTARMAAQIDQLSGGRMVLGMGAGWNVPEHEAFGISLPPVRERLDRLVESIEVVRALWTEGPANFEGEYFHLDGAECYPKPAQSPMPLLIGGNGEQRTLRITATYADEWNGVGLDAEGFRAKNAVLDARCAEIGRDPTTIRRSLMATCIVGRDEDELRRRFTATAGTHPSARGGSDPDDGLARMRARGALVGTPGELVERLGALKEAGAQRVMLQHLALDDFDALELLASDVLPQVQRAA